MEEFEQELNRLLALDLTPEQEDIARRYYSQKEREGMSASSFCGPHKSFPITSQADVDNAAHLVGHADNPNAVRACIKRKAKANGWKLPDSWTEKASRAMDAEDTFLYVPITRIDKDNWLVEGQATSDAVDHYNTVFDYESSKRAFQAWRGNIREMHDPTKAVGRAIEINPDDDNHAINVTARISRGARDTWEKVLDGTLSGFSIGVPKGKYKVKDVERNGKTVPMYYDHELAEVSLVDNPGSPGCNIAVVRADGVATDVLDDSTEEETPVTQVVDDLERRSVAISKMNRDKLHGIRNDAMQMCSDNGCSECSAIMAGGDSDHDGRSIEAEITRHMSPILARMNAMLSSYASRAIQTPSYPQPQEFSTEPLERRIADVERAFDTKLTEVRSVLTEVKELAVKIAAQPMPGGPVMMPMEKRLATSPTPGFNPNDDIAAIQRAATLGLFKDQDSQIAAAQRLIQLQNPGR